MRFEITTFYSDLNGNLKDESKFFSKLEKIERRRSTQGGKYIPDAVHTIDSDYTYKSSQRGYFCFLFRVRKEMRVFL